MKTAFDIQLLSPRIDARSTLRWTIALTAIVAVNANYAFARVKLITLPVRERVEIQLDNPGATLVEEERIVPLVKGDNQVDFSWANTQIDPNTIVFRLVGPAADAKVDVNVLSVSYPPNEAALVWAVSANESGSARVRISYLLGNLTKSFNYRAVASHDEKTLELSQYMRLQNLANEAFRDTGVWAGFGPHFEKPIGLNETKEMLVEKYQAVPIQKTYTCDPSEFGYIDRAQNKLRVPMHYVLKNDAGHHLGKAPLQYGKVRIFVEGAGEKAKASTAFLGEDWGRFTPKDDEMRLYLGVAQDIVVKRTIEKNESKRITGNLYNHDVIIKYEIENFKKEMVRLDVAENPRNVRNEIRGDTGRDVDCEVRDGTTFIWPDPTEPPIVGFARMIGHADLERSTADKLVFHAKLPPADANGKATKITHKLHITLKNEW